MGFLTLPFLLFFPAALAAVCLCPKKTQNLVLLLANALFYLWGAPLMGLFLAGAVLIGYICARLAEQRSRLFPVLGVLALFGTLLFFKYAPLAGYSLVMPAGISFYTFSLAGYLFDVYRGRIEAERDLVCFAAFASFFPSVLSGPINRAGELLPQLHMHRRFCLLSFKEGLWRFLWGAAKKLIVCSRLGEIINPVYADPYAFSSGAWALTAVAYSLYIYVDFSAYSDMALGTAKMLGITLPENFRAPYFSRSVKSFWKKWHISLTAWFREYLYFPLGGSRRGRARTWRNVLLVFAVSGIWHGAGWTFLVWGLLNGFYQVVGDWTGPVRRRLRARLHIPEDAWYLAVFQTVVTFGLITLTWVFFRAASVDQAVFICKRILLLLRRGPGPLPELLPVRQALALALGLLLCLGEDICIVRGKRFPLARTTFCYWTCAALLAALMFLLGTYGPGFNAQDFVYFQF